MKLEQRLWRGDVKLAALDAAVVARCIDASGARRSACWWACATLAFAIAIGTAVESARGEGPTNAPVIDAGLTPQEAVELTFDPNGPFDNDGFIKDPVGGAEAPVVGDTGDEPEGGSAPANDVCANATVIPGNVVVYNPSLLNTTGATNSPCEPGEPCESGGVGTSNSVWYSYTPNLDGSVEINTFGSNYNTVLSVWPGCGGGSPPFCIFLTSLACSDDAFFGTQSQLFMNVTAGVTYRIKVSDYNPSDGGGLLDFNLTWFPANDVCDNAIPIPGVLYDPAPYSTTSAGTETCEAQETCELNNVGVSNTVWYSYTAPCDGVISLNTNGSTYDTVLSVWDKCGFFYAVDFPCNFGEPNPVEIGCDDDSGTGLQSQILNLPVVGGEEYRIKVSDYNTTSGGGMLNFNFMFSGASQPDVEIASPTGLSCVCGGIVPVIGTAADPDGGPVNYVLDWMPAQGGAWTTISTGSANVNDGTLGNWNASLLPQGHYVLRLTATSACGLTSTAVVVVFVDQQFDILDVREPDDGDVFGDTVCFDGTVWDHCFSNYTVMWKPANSGAFAVVDPANPTYTSTVTNDPFAFWETLPSVPDGDYIVRVQGTDPCGHAPIELRTIKVDNTAPTAFIDTPFSCSLVTGLVEVHGTASDDNMLGWALQYTGGNTNNWVTISQGTSSITGLLGTWNTAGLPPCAYTLRLLVTDSANVNCTGLTHQSEYLVSVNVGLDDLACPVDLDGDGDEDLLDYAEFQNCFTGP